MTAYPVVTFSNSGFGRRVQVWPVMQIRASQACSS